MGRARLIGQKNSESDHKLV